MKSISALVGLAVMLVVSQGSSHFAFGEEQDLPVPQSPGFAIERMVVCESVQDREPVGEAEVFFATMSKVYCYLEARDIAADKTISFVWYFEENAVARVELTLRQGHRWRTYASKNIAGAKGDWKVELQDEYGNVLKAIMFRVE